MSFLSHINQNDAGMLDVSHKTLSIRTARAQAHVHIPASLGELLREKNYICPKGPLFHTAIIAGTVAAKNTAQLIPLCHNLALSSIKIHINLNSLELIEIFALIKTCALTGVEMEALTAVSVAALTIYDMCKSYSHDLLIGDIRLVEKTGGKSDYLWPGARRGQELTNEKSEGSLKL